jgi:L-asparaginase II
MTATLSRHPVAATDGAANPLVVEVTRGDMVESRHRAAIAILDRTGKVIEAWGDIERPVYGRSATKPIQALALVESGAAEHYGLGDAEIALACASHNGEARQVDRVTAWLARVGLGVDDLECGAHLPYDEDSAAALIRAGVKPTAAHNNCSGKHSGFLTTARHLGDPIRGYIAWDHPVQQRVLGVLEQMSRLDLSAAPRGIDGCGIPVIGMPLGNLALAMARLADPVDLPDRRADAVRRIRAAMAAEPYYVSGSNGFCTQLMTVTGATVMVKAGAEGVYTAALPTLGLGIALKIDDGAARASEVAMAALLRRLGLLSPAQQETLARRLSAPVLNRAGRETGRIRPAESAPF